MNWKSVKRKWEVAKITALIGTAFWFIQTVYFLIAYGWHLEAINKAEQTCDDIVTIIYSFSFILIGWVMIDIIEYLLTDVKGFKD